MMFAVPRINQLLPNFVNKEEEDLFAFKKSVFKNQTWDYYFYLLSNWPLLSLNLIVMVIVILDVTSPINIVLIILVCIYLMYKINILYSKLCCITRLVILTTCLLILICFFAKPYQTLKQN